MYNSKIVNTCNFLSLHSNNPEGAIERLEDLSCILNDIINDRDYDVCDITKESMSAIRDNMMWLEKYLDNYYSEYPTYHYKQLETLYLDICQFTCMIMINAECKKAGII